MPQKTEVIPVPGYRQPVVIFRRALSDAMCEDLLGSMEALWQPDVDALCRRKFDASPILHNLSTSCLDRYQDLLDVSPTSTARINAQAPLRAQGWHQDYVPEALVCYPEEKLSLTLLFRQRVYGRHVVILVIQKVRLCRSTQG